jgi:D-arabinose 1-dehydrogenase-like Zn-dependent alcohol dehydrogenase
MPKMRVVQVSRPGGPFEMVEREISQPGPRDVRVKVQACGLCHSDSLTKEGHFPGITYPRVPGHEIAGVIDAVGSAGRKRPARSGLASSPSASTSSVT